MGKLIVIEGTDGSGKSTQFELLAARLQQEQRPFKRLRFPRYSEESSALIRMYLGGAFGEDPASVNAYAASTFYAVDRYASYMQDWKPAYEAGELFLSDRYTTSNAVHQGSKLPDEERGEYLRWLQELEYEKMGLPRPDLVICLDMPTELADRLMRKRETDTHTSADIHEKNHEYLARCRSAALDVAAQCGWTVVSCGKDGRLRTIDEIHEEIYRHVMNCLEE